MKLQAPEPNSPDATQTKSASELTQQKPLALAFVNGEALIDKPEDLYIPPDALEVILDRFEGPLDLLLYLIRRQKLDIVELPVLQITKQYMEYVEVMTELKLELAGEYLLMAAMLAEIKSRLLLPKPNLEQEEEDDPRAELIRRLKAYEQIKQASQELDASARLGRDFYVGKAQTSENVQPIKHLPKVSMQDLAFAFSTMMQRASAFEHHQIAKETLSTRERMAQVLQLLNSDTFLRFEDLLQVSQGKAGVVVTFISILELSKEGLIIFEQQSPFSTIYVKSGAHESGLV